MQNCNFDSWIITYWRDRGATRIAIPLPSWGEGITRLRESNATSRGDQSLTSCPAAEEVWTLSGERRFHHCLDIDNFYFFLEWGKIFKTKSLQSEKIDAVKICKFTRITVTNVWLMTNFNFWMTQIWWSFRFYIVFFSDSTGQ